MKSKYFICIFTLLLHISCGINSFEALYQIGKSNYDSATIYFRIDDDKAIRQLEYADEYLHAALKMKKEKVPPDLYFMLGTINNKAYQNWNRAIHYLNLAKTEYEKLHQYPINYWKLLYNLGQAVLRSDVPDLELTKNHMTKILEQNLDNYKHYTDQDLEMLYILQTLSHRTLTELQQKYSE